jgi:CRISPR-associated protein Cas2
MRAIVLTKAHKSARGYLSRWMLEVSTGVFVGTLSARVWQEIEIQLRREHQDERLGGALMISGHPDGLDALEGLGIEVIGVPDRQVVNHDGVLGIKRPHQGVREPAI